MLQKIIGEQLIPGFFYLSNNLKLHYNNLFTLFVLIRFINLFIDNKTDDITS